MTIVNKGLQCGLRTIFRHFNATPSLSNNHLKGWIYAPENITYVKPILTNYCNIVSDCALRNESPYPGSWSAKNYTCTICGKSFFDVKTLNIHITKQHSAIVIDKLRKDPINTYRSIFGRENFKGISGGQLDFKNAITVTTKGKYEGIWKCWSDGSYGGPIKAIMKQNPEISYQDAVKYGAEIAGLKTKDLKWPTANLKLNDYGSESSLSISDLRRDESVVDKSALQRKLVAQEIWSKCISLQGTLAEVYLNEHRCIPLETLDRLEFKFLPHRSMWETVSYTDYDEQGMPFRVENLTPSLVVPVRDVNEDITAVQRIFLDKKSGGKPKTMKRHKYSKGVLHGSAGVVQKGKPGNIVFAAEGPETAASLAAVVDHDSTVLCSLSIVNFESMADVILSYSPTQVIIAADNDAAKENSRELLDSQINKLKQALSKKSDVKMKIIMPEIESSHKQNIDWNDVLARQGIDSLRDQICSKINM